MGIVDRQQREGHASCFRFDPRSHPVRVHGAGGDGVKSFFYEPSASRSAARRHRLPIRRLEWLCAEMLGLARPAGSGQGRVWVNKFDTVIESAEVLDGRLAEGMT